MAQKKDKAERHGDYSVYTNKFGMKIRRRASGPGKDLIRKDPAYKPIRDHYADQRSVNAAACLLRDAMSPVMTPAVDTMLYSRLQSRCYEVIRTDTKTAAGKKSVGKALKKQDSRKLFLKFHFNAASAKTGVVDSTLVKEANDEVVLLKAGHVKAVLLAPKAATHVKVQSSWTTFNFSGTGFRQSVSKVMVIALDDETLDLKLVPNRRTTRHFGCFDLKNKQQKMPASELSLIGLRLTFFQQYRDDLLELHDQKHTTGVVIAAY